MVKSNNCFSNNCFGRLEFRHLGIGLNRDAAFAEAMAGNKPTLRSS